MRRLRFRTKLVLFLSVLGLVVFMIPAVAAPPNNSTFYFTTIEAHVDNLGGAPVQNVDINGFAERDDFPPDVMNVGVHVGGIGGSIDCSLNANVPFFDGGIALSVQLVGVSEGPDNCGLPWVVDIDFEYDTHRERSHQNATGLQCKSTSQVDNFAHVNVKIVNDGVPILDARFENEGFYQSGSGSCHSTGKPGNPQP